MPRWADVVASEPAFAGAAEGFFVAFTHKTIATLRADGSPRISGIEATFTDEGELEFGSMWQAVKARDLLRDGRFALHSGSPDPPAWRGDAKVGGRAHEVGRPDVDVAGEPQRSHLFRAAIDEVALVRLGDPADHLVIELWRPGRPLKRIRR